MSTLIKQRALRMKNNCSLPEALEIPAWLTIIKASSCSVSYQSSRRRNKPNIPPYLYTGPLNMSPGIPVYSEYCIIFHERWSRQARASQHFVCDSSPNMYLVQYLTQHQITYYFKVCVWAWEFIYLFKLTSNLEDPHPHSSRLLGDGPQINFRLLKFMFQFMKVYIYACAKYIPIISPTDCLRKHRLTISSCVCVCVCVCVSVLRTV
jgi:hypothetical protein